MCCHIVKMLGCADLCSVFPIQIHTVLFDQLNESVQLRRDKKRINRIAEKDQVCLLQCSSAFCKVFLISFYTLPDVQVAELSVGKSIRNK